MVTSPARDTASPHGRTSSSSPSSIVSAKISDSWPQPTQESVAAFARDRRRRPRDGRRAATGSRSRAVPQFGDGRVVLGRERQRAEGRGPRLADRLELLGQPELAPEVVRHRRRGPPWRGEYLVDELQERAVEVAAAQPARGRDPVPARICSSSPASASTPCTIAATRRGSRVSYSTPPPSIVAGTAVAA